MVEGLGNTKSAALKLMTKLAFIPLPDTAVPVNEYGSLPCTELGLTGASGPFPGVFPRSVSSRYTEQPVDVVGIVQAS